MLLFFVQYKKKSRNFDHHLNVIFQSTKFCMQTVKVQHSNHKCSKQQNLIFSEQNAHENLEAKVQMSLHIPKVSSEPCPKKNRC